MYIGHYAAAAALVTAFPDSPIAPAAIGVAWPDLVWPVLVLTRRERVMVSRNDPLQRSIRFDSYPYSHSLVLSGLLAIIPAVLIGAIYLNPAVGVVFWLASISHWVLDLVMHLPDLPVVGWGARDRKLGLGLWRHPRTAFVVEYLFLATVVLITAHPSMYVGLLAGALVLHLGNANSFFGFTRRNPFGTPARYAMVTFVGYAAAIAWFLLAWR